VSLAEIEAFEAQALGDSLTGLAAAGVEEGPRGGGLGLARFMADVWTLVNAVLLGAGLEGARPRRVSVEFGVEEGLPWARGWLLLDGVLFYIYARPSIDVFDVDLAVDEAGEAGERLGAAETVPLVAGYEYTWDAERYAASIDVETVHLGR